MPGGDARTRQFDNQSRAAEQILRLVDAGLQVDWLGGRDVIALLELRGKERGGLARATAQDWARQGIDCREILRVYARSGLLRSQLAWAVEHRPAPSTVVAALWRGVDVTNSDIVEAGLKIVIQLWEERGFVEEAEFADGMLHLVLGLRAGSLDGTGEGLLRRDAGAGPARCALHRWRTRGHGGPGRAEASAPPRKRLTGCLSTAPPSTGIW